MKSASRKRFCWITGPLTVGLITLSLIGCSQGDPKLNEPMGYKTTSELKTRLLEVAKYGDGGSSLGGIPESIEALMKDDAEKGKKLQAAFQRLNTANTKDARQKIAQEMADQIE